MRHNLRTTLMGTSLAGILCLPARRVILWCSLRSHCEYFHNLRNPSENGDLLNCVSYHCPLDKYNCLVVKFGGGAKGRVHCPTIGCLLSRIDPHEEQDMIGSKGNFSSVSEFAPLAKLLKPTDISHVCPSCAWCRSVPDLVDALNGAFHRLSAFTADESDELPNHNISL